MYELLTGRVPFPGEGFGEILVAHLTKQPDPPSTVNPDVTPEIEAIVMHAIEKDRNRRYQTMDEFAEALKDPVAHMQAYSPLPGYQPQSPTYGAQAPAGAGKREPTGQVPVGPTTGIGQRPTTLSGAAAEMEGGVPRKSKMPLIAGAAVVLVGGAIAAVVGLKGKDQPKAPLVPAVVQNAPKDEKVKLTVRSDPPGAKVFRADTGESGVTPVTYEVKKGAPSFDVQVKADGYKSKTITLTTDHDQAKLAELEKGPEPVAATPPTTTPPPVTDDKTAKKDHHHSSSSSTTTKKKKGGEEGGSDDMKLLQPQF
jgi:hypothetical protein